jgi:uncharacterized membrane protein
MSSTFNSQISNEIFPISERVSGYSIRKSLLTFIQQQYPNFKIDSYLSIHELNHFREKYISQALRDEKGQLTELEDKVMLSMQDQTVLTGELDHETTEPLTFGQRTADKVASFGGSWTFIISFGVFLVIWILTNIIFLSNKGFDPYPFILLNLILSCIAALQAPVIMMSQNRQEEKDRDRAKKDYMINLKSELEIRLLHDKIDHLILHQQQELLEIQRVQIEMMNDILSKFEKK